MQMATQLWIFHLCLMLIAIAAASPFHLPLSTNSSWVVDRAGTRVKLACVSWAGHMETGIPEGLSKSSISNITDLIKASGFNCVRLTSSTWLWTRRANSTVADTLHSLNLSSALTGMEAFNPKLLHRSLRAVHMKVVKTLAAQGIMIVLDNHVSKPQWCCSETDGNGFWGDEYFDLDEWLKGLRKVARTFRNVSHVVAMSLRNELRGPHQNSEDWVSIIPRAASSVHDVNPDVLVIAGGLSYASVLPSLSEEVVPGKFMYEFHWYKWFVRHGKFDDPGDNDACERNVESDIRGSAHSHGNVSTTVPYFLSEFGVQENGDLSYGDDRFLACVIEYLAESQESWSLWALQGSYYLRDGKQDFDESFGVLDSQWRSVRNPELIARLRPIQDVLLTSRRYWKSMLSPLP